MVVVCTTHNMIKLPFFEIWTNDLLLIPFDFFVYEKCNPILISGLTQDIYYKKCSALEKGHLLTIC